MTIDVSGKEKISERNGISFNPDKTSDMKFDFSKKTENSNLNKLSDGKFDFSRKNMQNEFYQQSKTQDKIISDVISGKVKLENTQEKGNFGEMRTDQYMRELGYNRISKDMVTGLDDKGRKGLDGVYFKEGGHPPYAIVEAKYGSSDLNPNTLDGKQMSDKYIDNRLDAAVGKEKADEIRDAMLMDDVGTYVSRIYENGDIRLDKLDNNANIVEEGVKEDA